MRKTILLATLLLCCPAAALPWEMRIDGPVTITGVGTGTVTITGTGTITTVQSPVTPPVVPPVVPPPVTPPPVTPPVTPTTRDMTPFKFPAVCPGPMGDVITNRPIYLFDLLPGRSETAFYATLDGEGNPSVSTHVCAGVIKTGSTVAGTGRPVADRQLWVPYFVDGKQVGTQYPDQIRCALATGRACP